MIKLQCNACPRRCVKGFYKNVDRRSLSCPHGKQSEFKTQELKHRPGIYNAKKVGI